MKKFDIKKLFIIVLAFVMVFALVACNSGGTDDGGDGGDNPTPTPTPGGNTAITAVKYFDSLWAATKSLGSTAFDEDDSIGIDLDLDIKLAFDDDAVDIGVALSLVIDRTDGSYSAAKVKLYDKAAASNENWLTLYFFLEDPSNVYVNFKNQEFKVAFDTDGTDNGTYADAVDGFLNKDLIGTTSIADILQQVVGAGGSNWTIDSLLNVVLGFLPEDYNSIDKLLTLLGGIIDIPDMEEGQTSLLPVLEVLGPVLFPADATTGKSACKRVALADGSGYTYTGIVDSSLLGLVGGMLKFDGISGFGSILGDETEISLSFNSKEDASGNITGIDGFKLGVFLPDVDGKDLELVIGINDAKFTNLGTLAAGDAAEQLGFDADDFADYFDIDLDLEVAIVGNALVINPTATDQINCNGILHLSLNGFVDLFNDGAANKTAAYAKLTYKASASAAEQTVAELSYSQMDTLTQYGQLILEVDSSVTTSNSKSIVGELATYVMPMFVKWLSGNSDDVVSTAGVMLANALYTETFANKAAVTDATAFTFDSQFTGVVLQQLDLTGLFRGALASLGKDDAASTADAGATWILNIYNILEAVSGAFSVDNGVIGLKVSNVGTMIASLFDNVANADVALFGNTGTKYVDGIFGTGGNAPSDNWWSTFFAGSSWAAATEKATIQNLFKSGAEITINNTGADKADAGKITAKVTNGSASISAWLLLNITAEDSIKTYTEVARPVGASVYQAKVTVDQKGTEETTDDVTTVAIYDGVVTVGEGETAKVWCVLSVDQLKDTPAVVNPYVAE